MRTRLQDAFIALLANAPLSAASASAPAASPAPFSFLFPCEFLSPGGPSRAPCLGWCHGENAALLLFSDCACARCRATTHASERADETPFSPSMSDMGSNYPPIWNQSSIFYSTSLLSMMISMMIFPCRFAPWSGLATRIAIVLCLCLCARMLLVVDGNHPRSLFSNLFRNSRSTPVLRTACVGPWTHCRLVPANPPRLVSPAAWQLFVSTPQPQLRPAPFLVITWRPSPVPSSSTQRCKV